MTRLEPCSETDVEETINGRPRRHRVPVRLLLSDYIRDVVGLTGTSFELAETGPFDGDAVSVGVVAGAGDLHLACSRRLGVDDVQLDAADRRITSGAGLYSEGGHAALEALAKGSRNCRQRHPWLECDRCRAAVERFDLGRQERVGSGCP